MITTTTKNAMKYKALPTSNKSNDQVSRSSSSSSSSFRPLKYCISIIFSLCLVYVITIIAKDEQEQEDINMDGTKKGIIHLGSVDTVQEEELVEVEAVAAIKPKKINILEYKKELELSLLRLTKQIQLFEYGTYLDDLLFQNLEDSANNDNTNTNSSGISIKMPELLDKMFPSSIKAKERLIRRYQIKFLQSNLLSNDSVFTWSTAGHSASAAHGNLFNESYTSLIEDTVKDSFGVLNIDFHAYNYGMGGMSSSPELSLCEESVYGPDIDILNWDFGMTDGRKTHGINLFGHRAALHPTRPILFGFTGGNTGRNNAFFNFENQANISSIVFERENLITDRLPDSDKVDADIIPPALLYYKCSGKIESSGNCGANKYDTSRFCQEKIKGQVGWHPGWKDHMLKGRLIGLYLLHILYQSIINLVNHNMQSHELPSYLEQLINEEYIEKEYYKQHVTNFILQNDEKVNNNNSTTSIPPTPLAMPMFEKIENNKDINIVMHFRNAICRTALIPSHTRFNDIVFNRQYQHNDPKNEDSFLYTQGLSNAEYLKKVNPLLHSNKGNDPYNGLVGKHYYKNLKNNDNAHYYNNNVIKNDTLSIVHQENDNSKLKNCNNIQFDVDYKDIFFIGKNDLNTTLQIPNEAELQYYTHNNYNIQNEQISKCSIMFVLYTRCLYYTHVHGKCPKDYITIESLIANKNNPRIRFILDNEIILTNVDPIGGNAFMLRNNIDDSIYFDYDGSKNKPFELKFDIEDVGMYFYMTSIIFFQW